MSVPAHRSVQKPLQVAEPGSVSTAASKSADTNLAVPAASKSADTNLAVPAASQSADTNLTVPAASAAAVVSSCPPGNQLQPEPAIDSASDAPLQAASPTAAMPGRHHNVGPESTWAVRQSAELEDLQAALNRQGFRRGQPAPEEAVASSSESVSASHELNDDAEPR